MSDPDELSSYNIDVDWSYLEKIGEVAARHAPPLTAAGIKTAWGGLYEITPDHQPILGPVEAVEGFWCACGFSGHGFQQAPAVGLLLAQLLLDRHAEIDLAPFYHRRLAAGELHTEMNVV